MSESTFHQKTHGLEILYGTRNFQSPKFDFALEEQAGEKL